MPTQEQVLEAFDALGGNFNMPMALIKQMEGLEEGFSESDIVTAINAALNAGVLIQVESGSIRKA